MRVIDLKKPVAITAWSCVGGKKEKEGPLAAGFDMLSSDDYFGQQSWEKAETAMQKYSLRSLMETVIDMIVHAFAEGTVDRHSLL